MMRTIRDRDDARALPSRYRFALFRLAAYARMRGARARVRPGLLLIVDRDQSQFENYAISAWHTLTLTCFFAASFFDDWPLPAALIAGFFAAMVFAQTVVVVFGLLLRHIRAVSMAMMALVVVPAFHYVRTESWVRYVAWHVLALLALNALAAAVVFLLRGRIEQLDRAYETGGPSSAS